MGYSTLLYIITLFFLVFSCGSSEETNETHAASDSVKQTIVKNDTITQQDSIPQISPPDPAPAPGTVQVKGKVLSVFPYKNNSGGTFEFKVLQVLKYGSSTPGIASQDTLLVTTSKLPALFKKGTEFTGALKEHRVLAKFKNTAPKWQLIGIKINKDHK